MLSRFVVALAAPCLWSQSSVPETLGLDPFYKRYVDAGGIPVVSSEKPPDAALIVARDIINHMLSRRPELRTELVKRKWRVGVMALTEMTTDIPEHRNLKRPGLTARNLTAGERANYERIQQMTDKEYWDSRARGLGGNPTTCAEENLLGYPGTRYYGENILVHEFSHAIHNGAIRSADPALYAEIEAAYKEAMAKGLWKDHYGSTNSTEYWAEGTQTWFWSNYEFTSNGIRVQSPADLRNYDAKLYALLERVYPDHHIPADIYHARNISPPRRERLAESALHQQTDFKPAGFRERWNRIFDRIGGNAFAIVQGYPRVAGFILPRQTNEFYYLSGVETPGSYLVLDGKLRRATLFLPPRDERLERSEGRILSAADAAFAMRVTGAHAVMATTALTADWLDNLVRETGNQVYTPFAPAEGYAQSRHEIEMANAAIAADPWDGRPSREANFAALLKTKLRRAELRDLTPVLDELRIVKSPAEVALVKRSSQIAAQALIEAMRATRPGVHEYQLDAAARYIFQVNGARLDAYRSITASGTENIWNGHYYRNSRQLRDGDLVLMDYAPDYRYYVSDIARMWPVNGKFSPVQREILQFVLEYRNAILTRIRPGVTPRQIRDEAKEAMAAVFARTKFSKPVYEQAARKMVDTGGGVFSHSVGMAVHDVGRYSDGPLKPGHVFSVDPQLWVPEEKLYYRYEDVVVITDSGHENFTSFLPSELDDIERMVKGDGIVQRYPAREIR